MSKQCHFCGTTFWKDINGGYVNMVMNHVDDGGYRMAEMGYNICMKCYEAVRTTLLNIRKVSGHTERCKCGCDKDEHNDTGCMNTISVKEGKCMELMVCDCDEYRGWN